MIFEREHVNFTNLLSTGTEIMQKRTAAPDRFGGSSVHVHADGTASFHVEVDIEERLLSNNSTRRRAPPTLDETPGTDSSSFGYHGEKLDYPDTLQFSLHSTLYGVIIAVANRNMDG